MSLATAGEISLAYDDRGSGEPALLLLPGWCAGRGAFDDIATALAPVGGRWPWTGVATATPPRLRKTSVRTNLSRTPWQ